MKCLQFYREEIPNNDGHYLSDIMTWTHGMLEAEHSWIQWVFPINTESNFNEEAPVLTKEESAIFQSDPELKVKTKASFVKFLDFLGFKLTKDDDTGIEISPVPREEWRHKTFTDHQWWMTHFNHTMLRITRMLISLRLLGLTQYAIAFYNVLRTHKTKFSEDTWSYWYKAVFDELWHSGT